MRSNFQRWFQLCLLSALCACASPDEEKSKASPEPANVPCICGQPEAAVEGCAHPSCLNGTGNPKNPDCYCGTLSFEGKKEK